MEATRQSVYALIVVSLTVTVGCGQSDNTKVKSSSFYGQDCANQAQPKTFLVEWKDVPKEFEKLRIHPGSNITRFSKIDKTVLEKTILQKNKTQVISAEHEFKLKFEADPLNLDATSTCTATVLPNAWGPGDLQASDAWNFLGKKGEGVVVAVVDSGTDINHTLLASQIWTNPGEIPGNGLDDDKNGYIDDVHGLALVADNFGNTQYSSSVSDDSNHGTHVSGIIAGQAGSLGFTGVAPKAQIMPLKFIDGSGEGSVGDAITTMEYAVSKGAKVINASWGGAQCSDLLKQEIQNVISHGTVFSNAAGNSGKDLNNPFNLEWPAAFQLPGKITVGSMNQFQNMSTFSNYGVLVDLAAPGEAILSTVPPDPGNPHNTLCVKSGTSMATPFVSGIAALLLSAKPQATPAQIVNAMNASVTPGHFGVRTGGKLNALKAAQYLMSH